VGKMRMVAAPGSGREAGVRAKERHLGRRRPSWGGEGEREVRAASRRGPGRKAGVAPKPRRRAGGLAASPAVRGMVGGDFILMSGNVAAEVGLRGARSCYNEGTARGRVRRASRHRVGLVRAGLRAVLRAAGVVLAGQKWQFPVAVRPVGLTLRAADAATPRASRDGFRAKALRLRGWLDGTAAPLTPSLGTLVGFHKKEKV